MFCFFIIIFVSIMTIEGRIERAHVTDWLIAVDQKVPDWLIKIIFLAIVKGAIRSDIKSKFGIMGSSTSDTILGLWFSL